MDYNKIAPQFGTWAEKFKPFIESKEFDSIFAFLKSESREGKKICPQSTDVFRAFRECPFDNVKCIFILQDPYSWIKKVDGKEVYVADGIAMSSKYTGVCQPSLELFYEGMEDNLNIKVERQPDLAYLANQGILFLNTSLTVEANKPNSHRGRWDNFMTYLLEEVINFYSRALVYVSMGKNAEVTSKAIVPFLHFGLECEHPAAAAHKQRKWQHNNIFSAIDNLLKNNNQEKIMWNYGKDGLSETSSIKGKLR